MEEEKRPLDPTRRLLRVFGVTVTNYEERTAKILEHAAAGPPVGDLVSLAAQAIDLTADLSERLREVNGHVLDAQAKVLSEMKAALQQVQA